MRKIARRLWLYEKKKIIYKKFRKILLNFGEKIKQRTTYKVELDSKNLFLEAKKKIKKLAPIEPAKISVSRMKIDEFSVGEEFQSSYLSTRDEKQPKASNFYQTF